MKDRGCRSLRRAFFFVVFCATQLARSPFHEVLAHEVLVWHLDEGQGQATLDCSGNGNHGALGLRLTPENGQETDVDAFPTWIPDNFGGSALHFDGSDFVRTRVNSPALEPEKITVEAWVRGLPAPTGSRYIVSKFLQFSAVVSYGLFTGADKSIHFYVGVDRLPGSLGLEAITQPGLPLNEVWDNEWHHVAGTFDGKEAVLYVDGARRGSAAAAFPICYSDGVDKTSCKSSPLNALNTLYVGDAFDRRSCICPPGDPSCTCPPVTLTRNTSHAFVGDVDQVRVWSRALSGDEVRQRHEDDLSCAGALIPGVPVDLTLTPEQPGRCLKLQAPAGKSVILSLTDGNNLDRNALYVKWCEPAKPFLFDQAADDRAQASPRLIIHSTREQPCFVLAQGNVFNGGTSSVRLEAKLSDLALESISATSAGQGGESDISALIRGAGFDASTRFRLERPGCLEPQDCVPQGLCCSFEASDVRILSSTLAEVAFNLSGAPQTGSYALKAESSGGLLDATLDNAFLVTSTSNGPQLFAGLHSARKYRRNEWARLTLRYGNTGDEAMIAPLFKIVGPEDAVLRLEGETVTQDGELQVLGIHTGGVPGVLPPGAQVELPVYFRRPGDSGEDLKFQLFLFKPSAGDLVPWADIVPAEVAPENRGLVEAGLAGDLGGSWLDYHRSIAALATRLSRRGVYVASMRELCRFAVRKAHGRPSSAAVGRVTEELTGSPLLGQQVVASEVVSGLDVLVSSATTDPSGAFALDGLRGGHTYQIGLSGFEILPVPPVTLTDDEDALHVGIVATARLESSFPVSCCVLDESGLPQKPFPPPVELFEEILGAGRELKVIGSVDPNTKDGAGDQGDIDLGYVGAGDQLSYTVHFKNEGNAGTHVIVVLDGLDPDLDASTATFRDLQLPGADPVPLDACKGDLETGYACTSRNQSYSSAQGTVVQATFNLDSGTRTFQIPVSAQATLKRDGSGQVQSAWQLSIDPNATGTGLISDDDLSENPEVGFLPPQGTGYVSFSVEPRSDLAEGTDVTNHAGIQFDGGPFMETNEVSSTFSRVPRSQRPHNPRPASDPDARVPIDLELSWDSDGAVKFDLFLWRNGEEEPTTPLGRGFTGTKYHLGGLSRNTTYRWRVVGLNGTTSTPGDAWTFRTETGFQRGDSNADGELDLVDVIEALFYLLAGGQAPPCAKSADTNSDGNVNISDPIFLLEHLFRGGPAPGSPSGACGTSPLPDTLSCESYPPCG
jgi:uncharacterized repeat protein (TIGR01451 family)